MKKFIILIIFLSINTLSAQFKSSITLSGGIVDKDSYGALINYNYNSYNSNYEIGVLHSIFNQTPKENINVSFSTTVLQLGYLHTFLRNRANSLRFNIGLGAYAGIEDIKENENIVLKEEEGIIAGAYVATQIEILLSDRLDIIIRGQENYNFKSTTGKLNPYIGIGFKYNF